MRGRSIRTRIVVGVAVMAVAALILITGNAVLQINTASRNSDRAAAALRLGADFELLAGGIQQERVLAFRALAFPAAEPASALARLRAERDHALARIAADADGDAIIGRLVGDVTAATTRWHALWLDHGVLGAGGPPSVDATFEAEEGARFSDVSAAVDALGAAVIARGDAAASEFRRQAANNLLLSVPIGLLLVSVVVLAARWLLIVVVGPLRALSATTQAQLRGERVEFRAIRSDEIGEAARLLEQFRVQAQVRYDEAREEAARGAILAQLSDLISFATTESEVVDATVRTLVRLVPASRGDLQLVNDSRDRLIHAGAWGAHPPEPGSAVAVDAVERCPAIRRTSLYVVSDVADNLTFPCPAHPVERGALACVPLLAMGQPIGVIHLEGEGAFAQDVLGITSRIAEQVAVAIANARLMRTMESLAMTDGLTGLRNARFFDAHLERELLAARRDRQPVAVIILDVDAFKQFNDTNGHPAGDEALRSLARTITGTVRATDVSARYGGEEFVVALHNTDLAGAAVVAEKLRQAIAAVVVEIGPGRFGRITASLGVASTDGREIEPKALVTAADAALYRAKTSGRNRVCLAEGTEADEAARPGERPASEPTPITVPRRRRAAGASARRRAG